MQIPYNFTPRPYQLKLLQALDGGCKRAFLRWHRRAGKDKVCGMYMFKEAARVPGNYFYIFPTKEMAKRAFWEQVDKNGMRMLDHICIPLKDKISVNNQEMVLKLENGSTVRCIGLDTNPDAIRGVAAKGTVLSEFAFSDPEAFKILAPSIREAEGWLIINSTPNGRNHFYDFEMGIKDRANWYVDVRQSLYPDEEGYTGLVSEDDIKEMIEAEGLTAEDIEREIGCSYDTGRSGAIYADQIEEARKNNRIGSFPHSTHSWVDTFWDLGVSDPTSIFFIETTGSKITIIDYFEDTGKDVAYYISMLKSKPYNYRTHYVPHDSKNRNLQTGKSTIDLFQEVAEQAGISTDFVAVPKPLKKMDAIYSTRAEFSKMYFNSDSEAVRDAINKLSLYHFKWDKKKKTYIKDPVHDWTSHCADAFSLIGHADVYEPREQETQIKIINTYDMFDEEK